MLNWSALPCPAAPVSKLEFIFDGVLTLVTAFLGLVGIFYSSYRLVRRVETSRNRLVRLVLALSVWDTMLLFSATAMYGVVSVVYGHKTPAGTAVYLYQVFYPIASFCMTGSLWTVVAISFERYLAVSKPFQQRIRERRSTKPLCFILTVGALLFNAPKAFELTQDVCFSGYNPMPLLTVSWLRQNRFYLLFYRLAAHLIFVCPLPLLIITALSVRILVLYRSALRWRRSLSVQELFLERNSGKMEALIIAANFKVLLCNTLPMLANIVEIFPAGFLPYHIVQISNLLVVVNSASNWLVYSHWHGRLHSGRRFIRRTSFSRDQTNGLNEMWSSRQTDTLTVGTELLETLIRANPDLVRHLLNGSGRRQSATENGEMTTETVAEIRPHGLRMARFLDSTIGALISGEETGQIKVRIRAVGRRHAVVGVSLQNKDWFTFKEFLIDRLFKPNSVGNSELAVANKFVSFLIREFKVGFHCHESPGQIQRRRNTSDV